MLQPIIPRAVLTQETLALIELTASLVLMRRKGFHHTQTYAALVEIWEQTTGGSWAQHLKRNYGL